MIKAYIPDNAEQERQILSIADGSYGLELQSLKNQVEQLENTVKVLEQGNESHLAVIDALRAEISELLAEIERLKQGQPTEPTIFEGKFTNIVRNSRNETSFEGWDSIGTPNVVDFQRIEVTQTSGNIAKIEDGKFKTELVSCPGSSTRVQHSFNLNNNYRIADIETTLNIDKSLDGIIPEGEWFSVWEVWLDNEKGRFSVYIMGKRIRLRFQEQPVKGQFKTIWMKYSGDVVPFGVDFRMRVRIDQVNGYASVAVNDQKVIETQPGEQTTIGTNYMGWIQPVKFYLGKQTFDELKAKGARVAIDFSGIRVYEIRL